MAWNWPFSCKPSFKMLPAVFYTVTRVTAGARLIDNYLLITYCIQHPVELLYILIIFFCAFWAAEIALENIKFKLDLKKHFEKCFRLSWEHYAL